MDNATANPVLVEVLRGGTVESFHRGRAVAVRASGEVVAAWGDGAGPVFPRSALKPVQALPLIETGAAAAFGLGTAEIALAAASHSGEPAHIATVAAWLARLGLGVQALECGAGTEPSALHNNCSGKHAGFLTVARHLGVETAGYIQPHHPVQRLVAAAIAAMAGVDAAALPCGVDGCGIPAFAVPLERLALAMAHLADPAGLPPARRQAARAVVAAMTAHPRLVAGSGRLCTAVMEAVPGLAVKGGAEGVYVAIAPALGLGVAVKIDDGAGRAAEVAVMAVLCRLGLLDAAQAEALAERIEPPLRNAAGRVVGGMRCPLSLPR